MTAWERLGLVFRAEGQRPWIRTHSQMPHAELIVESWDDYVERAAELTRDAVALDALRRKVRERFDASGRRDEAGFARRFEGQLAQMFNLWRERLASAAA